MRYPRRGASAAVLDNKIFVAGGYTSESEVTKTVEMFDPVTGVWSLISEMCMPRAFGGKNIIHSSFHSHSRAFYVSTIRLDFQVFAPTMKKIVCIILEENVNTIRTTPSNIIRLRRTNG